MKIVRSCMLILVLFGVWILPVGCGSSGSSGSTSVSTPTTPTTVPTSTTVPLTQQVQNPVALFSTDNNGVIIELPSVTDPTASLTGSLVFGISTQSNNVLSNSTANTFYLDSSGYINTNFNGSTSIPSFIDSGSNGYFFQDAVIYQCSATSNAYGFYCTSGPSDNTLDPQNLTATISDNKGNNSPTVDFSVGDAVYMFTYNGYKNYAVFNTLGGPFGSNYFDWGLPFFYGNNVYTSITPDGDGSYYAFTPYTAPSGTTNVQTITVNGGPLGDYANGAFTSVKVCVPGTSTCQTIDGVLVDTGTSGLRLLSSVLTLSLPAQQIGGGTLGECVQFADGSYIWGSVRTADVYLANGNEIAHSVPIHVLNSTFSTLPSDCSSGGGPEEDDLLSLGANGILGIGSTRYDCPACASSVISATYYTCPSS